MSVLCSMVDLYKNVHRIMETLSLFTFCFLPISLAENNQKMLRIFYTISENILENKLYSKNCLKYSLKKCNLMFCINSACNDIYDSHIDMCKK